MLNLSICIINSMPKLSVLFFRDFQHGKDKNDWHGPPHDGNMNIKSVEVLPFVSFTCA